MQHRKVINDATSLTSFMETAPVRDRRCPAQSNMVHFYHFDVPGLKEPGPVE